MLEMWSTCSALVLGMYALWTRDASLVVPVVVLSHVAFVATAKRVITVTKDVFAFVILVLAVGLVRFTIPWLLLTYGRGAESYLFDQIGLRHVDWQFGEILALLGLLGICLGWLLLDRFEPDRPLLVDLPESSVVRATLAMVFGLVFLYAYVSGNAGSVTTIAVTGGFRALTIQEGTGVFFFLALLLIVGAVVQTAYFVGRNGFRLTYLTPAFVATLAYFVLGGRARAAVPIGAALITVWYCRRSQQGWDRRLKRLAVGGTVLGLLALWLAYAGALYRGSGGLAYQSGYFSWSGMQQYLASSFIIDLGQLHGPATATLLGPGLLHGRTFLGDLTFPLGEFFPIPGRNAGAFLVESTIGFFTSRKWGIQPSLAGDAYLNFGVWSVPIVTGFIGGAMRYLYHRLRLGELSVAFYALAAIYGIRMVFESLDLWGEMLVVLVFASLLTRGARARSSPSNSPSPVRSSA